MNKIKDFFKDYGGVIGKIFINHIAMSIFGLMVCPAALAINKVLYWLGGIQADTSEQAEELMVSFLKKMDISYSLSDLNIHGDMIELLMEKVTGNLANDKLASRHNIVKSIFTETL